MRVKTFSFSLILFIYRFNLLIIWKKIKILLNSDFFLFIKKRILKNGKYRKYKKSEMIAVKVDKTCFQERFASYNLSWCMLCSFYQSLCSTIDFYLLCILCILCTYIPFYIVWTSHSNESISEICALFYFSIPFWTKNHAAIVFYSTWCWVLSWIVVLHLPIKTGSFSTRKAFLKLKISIIFTKNLIFEIIIFNLIFDF